jgi:enoyl-CoA hydratase/carnithine racemase
MTAPLRLLRDGAQATLLLDRPERRNAMTRAMWLALPGLLAEAATDEDVALLRLEGAGGHFCGGADIAEFAESYATPEASAASDAAIRAAVEAVATFPKPIVAVIRGACVGGGVALALACDLRFAASDARFAVTPVRLGLAYSHADTQRLVRAIGLGPARDLLFSARAIDAAEALRLGLIERLWPAESFDADCAASLAALAETSRPALRHVKAMLAAIADGVAAENAATRALFEDLFTGADFAEGYRAFLEKRAPRFTAR